MNLGGLRRLKVQTLSPEGFLFGGADPLRPQWVQHRWRRAPRAAGMRYRPPQALRHTFASQMLSRGAHLLYVQRQGGWRSASVLLGVYSRWLPQDFLADSKRPAEPQVHPSAARVEESPLATGTYGAGRNFQK